MPGALPCGECSANDAPCSSAVQRDCGRDAGVSAGFSPLDAWLCACEGGAWVCWVAYPAAAACVSASDAGT
jgi:hypothetical protein